MRAMATGGMVASPHYLATATGLHILRKGGTAVDAAIGTNAVLAVVTPYVCGIGGDLFAQVYSAADRSLVGLNGSGRAAAEATPERVRELTGGARIPARSPLAVTVPGCVEGWGRLHERFGRLPLAEILTDAIHYAGEGFPVTHAFSASMAAVASFLHLDTPAAETFLPDGVPPAEGQILVQARIARTLRAIAQDGPDVFYRGWVADELVHSLRAVGGLLSTEDLAEHRSDWVEPLSIRYRDITVYELPPNSQGVIALLMLGMLDRLPADPIRAGGEEYIHLLAEVQRLAYADRLRFVTDPDHMTIAVEDLLSDRWINERVVRVRDQATSDVLQGNPGDTIYLCTADAEGNLVSLIQSNWMGIGSGVMAGETGVMLHNRGHWFSLDPTDANVIAPRKRTMHTLMPGMAFRDEKPCLVFGTMGGSGQAQIHVELLTRIIDQGLQLDDAIAAPRFDAVVGGDGHGRPAIMMEGRFAPDVVAALERRGHGVRLIDAYSSAVGHAHAIQILENGVYVGAADPRHDSLALGY
jgi:gamma-glutamyltranspeptidase